MAVVFVVQMTVVQVVNVVVVFDGGVAAVLAVNVVVFVMGFAGHDGFLHETVCLFRQNWYVFILYFSQNLVNKLLILKDFVIIYQLWYSILTPAAQAFFSDGLYNACLYMTCR